jgi:hypothetical protein
LEVVEDCDADGGDPVRGHAIRERGVVRFALDLDCGEEVLFEVEVEVEVERGAIVEIRSGDWLRRHRARGGDGVEQRETEEPHVHTIAGPGACTFDTSMCGGG